MDKINNYQKSLLFVMYGLIILMIVFSLMATKNIGQEGYEKCIQDKCDKQGTEYCSKYREINNCCLGAGGQTIQTQNGFSCQFKQS